jgi:hypothetical protein
MEVDENEYKVATESRLGSEIERIFVRTNDLRHIKNNNNNMSIIIIIRNTRTTYSSMREAAAKCCRAARHSQRYVALKKKEG